MFMISKVEARTRSVSSPALKRYLRNFSALLGSLEIKGEQDWGTLLHLMKKICSNNVHAALPNGSDQQGSQCTPLLASDPWSQTMSRLVCKPK